MGNRSESEGDTQPARDDGVTQAAPRLRSARFRGELLGLRPSSRTGLTSARLGAADRIRKLLESLNKDPSDSEHEET